MWICHCAGANDRQIREAVASGATDVDGVGRVCGAATQCGGCADEVRRILDQLLAGASV